jgi:hypothetical protein
MTHQNKKIIHLRRLCRAGDFLLEEAHIATMRMLPMHINKGKTIALKMGGLFIFSLYLGAMIRSNERTAYGIFPHRRQTHNVESRDEVV